MAIRGSPVRRRSEPIYCRVFQGQALPGKAAEALEVIRQQVGLVRRTTGMLLVQVLQGDGEILIISSWRSAKDLRAYAESALATDFVARLTPLLVAPPSVRSLAITLAVEGSEPFLLHDEGGEG
jgi:quinol monooxygenase YgiN